MKKYILIGLVVLASGGLLVACGGGSSSNELEMINGIIVPPDPGEEGKETLAGIDSNNNGVRDDIERIIAEEHAGNMSDYEYVKEVSIKLQKIFKEDEEQAESFLNSQLESDIYEYIKSIDCAHEDDLDKLGNIEKYFGNTRERVDRYRKAMLVQAGSVNCDN